MDISNELIDKLADLAKLEFNGEDKEKMKADLVQITTFFDELNKVDTEGIEPLIFMSDAVNVLREDVVKEELTHEEALKNAPAKDSDYFRVPKFIEK
jgi:aspartyl-tRNA(Asn)/glutamyl-tRNA(Gln) amidotransferase subunit C